VTIKAGTVTTIAKATEVAAQNIPAGISNTVLGGFATNFTGEAVSVQNLKFTITTSSKIDPLTSVSIFNESGAVVAG
ncbi:hypothetical protein RYX56_25750, partial [Alkalihalophilus lindianensis]